MAQRKNNAIRRKICSRASLITLAALGAGASASLAQITTPEAPLRFRTDYLGYAVSVSPRVTYTDNIDLAPDALADDDIILSNLLTANAIFSNRRFTGILNGNIDFSYLTDDGDFRINQDIGAVSTVTLADNWAYIDVAGQTSRQLVGDNARFSANRNAARGQQANVHSYSVSPYLYHRFPNQSVAELRYRFSQVFIDENEDGDAGNFSSFLNDSRTHEALASYQSGALFDRVRFTLSAYGNDTVEEGSAVVPRFEYEQGTLTAEAQVALNRSFSLSGAIGYDEIDTTSQTALFDDDELSGVFWRAGFTAQPGRRTQLRIEYGQRYDDDFIDASLRYDISQRFTLRAGAARTFQTRSQLISRRFRSLQQQTLEFADRLREGDELSPQALIDGITQIGGTRLDAQSVGIGASNDAFIQLSGAFDRTNVGLNVNYQDTDFGFRQNEVIGGSLNVTRDLSRKLRGYGDVFFRHSDTTINLDECLARPFLFGINVLNPNFNVVDDCNEIVINNGRTNTVGGRVGAAYQLYKNVSVFGEYAHTERFSPVDILEYSENTVSVGVTLDF